MGSGMYSRCIASTNSALMTQVQAVAISSTELRQDEHSSTTVFWTGCVEVRKGSLREQPGTGGDVRNRSCAYNMHQFLNCAQERL